MADRRSVYRREVPFEQDVLLMERYIYEGLGHFALDILGATTCFARLAALPTSPASLAVTVGPGCIYQKAVLEPTPWGQRLATGGLPADVVADHQIMKQGIHRDTETFAMPAPIGSGQSVVYLIQAQFVEVDTDLEAAQFYNTQNPGAPDSADIYKTRADKCVISVKTGTAATTGTQTAPGADAGCIPLWAVTVAFGATTITAPNIVAAAGAPAISIGGGGGGGSALPPWQTVSTTYTAVAGNRLKAKTAGGAFTITFPASPADGDEIEIIGNFATNNLTINRNGKKIAGSATNFVFNKNNRGVKFVYDSGDGDWYVK